MKTDIKKTCNKKPYKTFFVKQDYSAHVIHFLLEQVLSVIKIPDDETYDVLYKNLLNYVYSLVEVDLPCSRDIVDIHVMYEYEAEKGDKIKNNVAVYNVED